MTTHAIATPIEEAIEEILTTHNAYEAVAAVMEYLVTHGASRRQAIAAVVRWARETANDWQG